MLCVGKYPPLVISLKVCYLVIWRHLVFGLSICACIHPSMRGHILKVCEYDISLTICGISPYLQLNCSLGQRWTNQILMLKGQGHDKITYCQKSLVQKVNLFSEGGRRGPSSVPCYLQWNTSLTTHNAAWYIILVVSVCLSVCELITFESLDVESSFLLIPYICREYGSGCTWRSLGQGHQSNDIRKSLFSQHKTLIGNNSASVAHRAMKFACSRGFRL